MSADTHDHRPRWRPIDVIAVVVLLGLLAMFLLPAHRGARKNARYVQCQNNLHNITVAFEGYLTAHNGRLPALAGERPGQTWQSRMMPGLGRPDIAKLLQSEDSVERSEAFEATIQVLQCPVDRSNFQEPGATSYVANLGYVHESVFRKPNCETRGVEGEWSDALIDASAVFHRNKRHTKEFTMDGDGLAQTIFFAESARPRKWYRSWNGDVGFGASIEFGPKSNSLKIGTGVRPLKSSSPIADDLSESEVSSASLQPVTPHERHLNVVMGDGSTRSISVDIDFDVYCRLLTSSGRKYGELAVQLDEF